MRVILIKNCAISILLVCAMSPQIALSHRLDNGNAPCKEVFTSFHEMFLSDKQKWGKDGAKGFELSQCYPPQKLELTPEELPWYDKDDGELDFSRKEQQEKYLTAILKYGYEGNLEVNWEVQKNKVRRWYHAPWLHLGGTGREPVHGLTYELASEPRKLAERQSRWIQNWAVSSYNAPGGYVIGKVWADTQNPDPDKALFPKGTVAIKLLFTEATPAEVPYLRGQEGKEWQAYIYKQMPEDHQRPVQESPRELKKLRLLQVDVAVRDDRSPTRWVFGTFVYNGNTDESVPPRRPVYEGCEPADSPFCRVVPVGMMWGNDPDLTPQSAESGKEPQQSYFSNPKDLPEELWEVKKLIKGKGLGWGGRLNGPVDNPQSSCLSCHMTASKPLCALAPGCGFSDHRKMAWFQNFKMTSESRAPFWRNGQSFDYSLQLAFGADNLDQSMGRKNQCEEEQPIDAKQPQSGASKERQPINTQPSRRDFYQQKNRSGNDK